MIATSYLGRGMKSALRNKSDFPSHRCPTHSEAVRCAYLEKEPPASRHPLPFYTQRGKLIPFADNKPHLGLWPLRAPCRWVRTTICYLGWGARTQQPQEPLRSQHLPRTGHCQHCKTLPISPEQGNSRRRPIILNATCLAEL